MKHNFFIVTEHYLYSTLLKKALVLILQFDGETNGTWKENPVKVRSSMTVNRKQQNQKRFCDEINVESLGKYKVVQI